MGDNEFNPLTYMDSTDDDSNQHDTPDPAPTPAEPTSPKVEDDEPTQPIDATAASDKDQATAPKTNGKDVYAERRANAIKIGLIAALAFVWIHFNGIPGAAPSHDDQRAAGNTRDATADSITAQANNDQAAAQAHYDEHGTLDNIELQGDVRWAAAGSTLVASRSAAGTCFMYGWVDQQKQAPVIDATGQACTDEAVAAAQAELTEQAAGIAESLAEAADDSFAAAATGARQYAMSNWVNGEASLLNIPTDLGHGVTVVDNRGYYIVAQATNGTDCQEVSIGADGTVGEALPCE